MTFTTRPEITGTFGMVTSTHWIASAVGMRILEHGGNAFDAAAATGFVLQVVEPHLNGPLGDMPLLIWPEADDDPTLICAQGTAPAGATIEYYRDQGLDQIPGSGLLAAVVPGAFDGWMLMLRDHGSLPLRDILEPAIHYARTGHPVLPRVSATIKSLKTFFAEEWPTSFQTWLPGGNAPEPRALFRNPQLAETWAQLLTIAESKSDRIAQIETARDAFYRGFVAEKIDDWMRSACVMDATGERRMGVLSGHDMSTWEAQYENCIRGQYRGWTVYKPGFWSQGPVQLQCLNILSNLDVDPRDADRFIHLTVEAMKLGFADREAYYGDAPQLADLHSHLLSAGYAKDRSHQISDMASMEQRPGVIDEFSELAQAAIARATATPDSAVSAGVGEPTMAHLSEKRGDTVHLDVVDRWGNMVSATPSGGWLQSSPVVPGLGMPLNTRAQMFWLDPGLPTSLEPGKRPRTTLSPSMARSPDGERLAFGTPGGDQQDQWQLIFLLRLAHGEMNLQAAIDAPLFHTTHFQGSFYPRRANPGNVMIEPGFGEAVTRSLRARGHVLEIAQPWTIGRLTAAARSPSGVLRSAATPRLMQAYAVGR